ncbi:hypothetical protein [Candidatus Protofrankia datiscae]|nr:hypothetical protein [Candidatus Protofrankia datiscae]
MTATLTPPLTGLDTKPAACFPGDPSTAVPVHTCYVPDGRERRRGSGRQ